MVYTQRAILLGFFMLSLLGCQRRGEKTAGLDPKQVKPSATFGGAQQCAECHQTEVEEWQESDHHLAMQKADATTVLGDFDEARFVHFGVETAFFKKGDRFFVRTPDSEGKVTEYAIDYTFGHYPLQQYLIKFPGGRYQALSICWDSRPEEAGGQRWFHLYPDEEIPTDDALHWTRQHFNWNYMCAD